MSSVTSTSLVNNAPLSNRLNLFRKEKKRKLEERKLKILLNFQSKGNKRKEDIDFKTNVTKKKKGLINGQHSNEISSPSKDERKISKPFDIMPKLELVPNPFIHCFLCGKESHYACKNCKMPYCSTECQSSDFPSHQNTCKQVKRISESLLLILGECSNLDSSKNVAKNISNQSLHEKILTADIIGNKTTSETLTESDSSCDVTIENNMPYDSVVENNMSSDITVENNTLGASIENKMSFNTKAKKKSANENIWGDSHHQNTFIAENSCNKKRSVLTENNISCGVTVKNLNNEAIIEDMSCDSETENNMSHNTMIEDNLSWNAATENSLEVHKKPEIKEPKVLLKSKKEQKDTKIDVAIKSKLRVRKKPEIDVLKVPLKSKLEVDKVPEKRKPKVALKSNKESSDDVDDSDYVKESSDEVDEDSDFIEDNDYSSDESYSPKKRRNRYRSEIRKSKVKKSKMVSLTPYEMMVEKNKAEKMAFLQSLKIDEAKSSLSEILIKPKIPRVKNRIKPTIVPRPKSERSKNSTVNYSEKALIRNSVCNEIEEVELPEPIPKILSFEKASEYKGMYRSYQKDIRIQKPVSKGTPISYDKSVFEKMTFKKFKINRNIKDSAWYPSNEHQIIANGDTLGNIGIWNVNSDFEYHHFKVHNRFITCLQFNPFNPVELFSVSLDGTIRCGDIVKEMFYEVINLSKNYACSYFDFLTPEVCLVSLREKSFREFPFKRGNISLVDRRSSVRISLKRSPGICSEFSSYSDSYIKTVNVHPVNKNIFVAAKNNGLVHLYDLRNSCRPFVQLEGNSAFFSPVTGNSLLSTSANGKVRIYDCTNLTSIQCQSSKNMPFVKQANASWLTNSDDMIVANGSPEIEIYDKQLTLYHTITSERSMYSLNFSNFHPFIPVVFRVSYNKFYVHA